MLPSGMVLQSEGGRETMRAVALSLWCVAVACLLAGWYLEDRAVTAAGTAALVLYIIVAARARRTARAREQA
jgi:hypothetical protein